MKTRDILHYGSIGFFSGFCASGFSQCKVLGSGAYQKEFIAITTLPAGILLMMYEDANNYYQNKYNNKDVVSMLIPYTLGIMAGALSNIFLFKTMDVLAPASSPAPKM